MRTPATGIELVCRSCALHISAAQHAKVGCSLLKEGGDAVGSFGPSQRVDHQLRLQLRMGAAIPVLIAEGRD